MSLSCEPIGELTIGGQSAPSATAASKTPRKRKVTARADRKGQPEPR